MSWYMHSCTLYVFCFSKMEAPYLNIIFECIYGGGRIKLLFLFFQLGLSVIIIIIIIYFI